MDSGPNSTGLLRQPLFLVITFSVLIIGSTLLNVAALNAEAGGDPRSLVP